MGDVIQEARDAHELCRYKLCKESRREKSKYCHKHRMRRFWCWADGEEPQDAMRITARSCEDAAIALVRSMGCPHWDGHVFVAGHDHEPLKLPVDYEASSERCTVG